MCLLSACAVWLLVQRDDGKWILLWSSRNHFSLPHDHGLSLLQYWMVYHSSEFPWTPRNCLCKWLLVSLSAPGTSLSSSGSHAKILFCTGRTVTTGLLRLAPLRHIGDCSGTHFLHLERCDPLVSSHQKFSALGMTASARLLQEVLVSFVFKQISQFGSFGKCVNTLCLPEPGSTCARGSIGESWDELEVLALLCIRSPRRFSEVLSSTKILSEFLQPVRQFTRCISCTSSDSLFFCVSVSVESCTGSSRSSSFIPLFLSDPGASTALFSDTKSMLADVDSCDEDGDEADEGVVEEEVADIPGTTNGT